MSFSKTLKFVVPLLMAVLVVAGWISCIRTFSLANVARNTMVQAAEESVEEGLFAQAIEQYQEAIREGYGEEGYEKIQETYELYYEEDHTPEVRSEFISFLEEATTRYPGQANYWERACELYLEDGRIARAYALVNRASSAGVSSEYLSEIQMKLKYSASLDYRLYYEVSNPLGEYMALSDGTEYKLCSSNGSTIRDGYSYIGTPSPDGYAIYLFDSGSRLLDAKGVARSRTDVMIENAGCFDSETGLVPVKIDGSWRYYDTESKSIRKNTYTEASAFEEEIAAVQMTDGTWAIIDVDEEVLTRDFDEVKFDLYGRCITDGLMLCKIGDKWHLYDKSFNQIGDFACDGFDVNTGGGPIAFEDNKKWGYVTQKGDVICEPQYVSARSYSCGLAAVELEQGLWGFIDEANNVVIEPQYIDAGYFNEAGYCFVSKAESTYQLLGLMYR